jgi:hypothetical protein
MIFIPLTLVRVWVTLVLKEPFLDGGANHCAIEFCIWLGKSKSETLQLNHQAHNDDDDALRCATVFKWWKRFRDGEK